MIEWITRLSALDFLDSLSTKISRYLSPQIYRSIFSGQKDVTIHTERKRLTIFFSDIQGELSLGEAFAHFGIRGNPSLIRRYFDAFCGFELYPDVLPTLDVLGRRHRLAIVSNIDDDLLFATRLGREIGRAHV